MTLRSGLLIALFNLIELLILPSSLAAEAWKIPSKAADKNNLKAAFSFVLKNREQKEFDSYVDEDKKQQAKNFLQSREIKNLDEYLHRLETGKTTQPNRRRNRLSIEEFLILIRYYDNQIHPDPSKRIPDTEEIGALSFFVQWPYHPFDFSRGRPAAREHIAITQAYENLKISSADKSYLLALVTSAPMGSRFYEVQGLKDLFVQSLKALAARGDKQSLNQIRQNIQANLVSRKMIEDPKLINSNDFRPGTTIDIIRQLSKLNDEALLSLVKKGELPENFRIYGGMTRFRELLKLLRQSQDLHPRKLPAKRRRSQNYRTAEKATSEIPAEFRAPPVEDSAQESLFLNIHRKLIEMPEMRALAYQNLLTTRYGAGNGKRSTTAFVKEFSALSLEEQSWFLMTGEARDRVQTESLRAKYPQLQAYFDFLEGQTQDPKQLNELYQSLSSEKLKAELRRQVISKRVQKSLQDLPSDIREAFVQDKMSADDWQSLCGFQLRSATSRK